jgi:hypothetical protein
MLDVLNLPKPQNGYIDYFFGHADKISGPWQTWEKPRGISMIDITCIGAGGGGRSGWCADSTTRSGGGGGGSGGFTKLLIPAMVLPDVLYLLVGKGGAGGVSIFTAASTTGMSGANGIGSFVSIAPSTAAIYTACFANGGGGGSILSVGTNAGGGGGSVATQTSALMSGLGQFFALAGQTGAAGPTASATALAYPTTGLLLSGGGGGGGSTFSSGAVTAPTYTSFVLVPTRTAPIGQPGNDGISLSQPLMSIGGAGGDASSGTTTVSGKRGGNGGIGCGGGGGGAGPSVPGSGAGGSGGDGLVIIQCF